MLYALCCILAGAQIRDITHEMAGLAKADLCQGPNPTAKIIRNPPSPNSHGSPQAEKIYFEMQK